MCLSRYLQFLTNEDGSGKFAYIICTPANVMNIWGGVLSPNQIFNIYDYQVYRVHPPRGPEKAVQDHLVTLHFFEVFSGRVVQGSSRHAKKKRSFPQSRLID